MQIQVIIFFLAHGAEEQTHIGKPFIDPIHDGIGISAVCVELYLRVLFMKFCHHTGDGIHSYRFTAADKDIPTQIFRIGMERSFCVFKEFHDLMSTVA